jgi:hypothetical protein
MSNFDVGGILKRGEVYPSGTTPSVYGRTFTFPNLTNLTNRAPRDPRMVWMMYVKNGEASLALLPGQLVAWKTALDGAGQVVVSGGHRRRADRGRRRSPAAGGRLRRGLACLITCWARPRCCSTPTRRVRSSTT